MAYFAEVENGVVLLVIVIDQATLNTGRWGAPSRWVETKEEGAQRRNYAGVGYTYDPSMDAFIPPKPFASWTLEESKCQWKAPVEAPKDGKMYGWDEKTAAWVEEVNP